MFLCGISYCYPIFGYRRRPYIILGWLITFLACFIMAMIPRTTLIRTTPTQVSSTRQKLT